MSVCVCVCVCVCERKSQLFFCTSEMQWCMRFACVTEHVHA